MDLPMNTSSCPASKAALPAFKQYRDTDGRFYFKLTDAEGNVLVQSNGFDSPKDAGKLIGVDLAFNELSAAQLAEIAAKIRKEFK